MARTFFGKVACRDGRPSPESFNFVNDLVMRSNLTREEILGRVVVDALTGSVPEDESYEENILAGVDLDVPGLSDLEGVERRVAILEAAWRTPGTKGEAGNPGRDVYGPQGPAGEPGTTVTGPDGPQGVPGRDITGPKGETGDPGRDVTGQQGPRGNPGRDITGPRGETGPDGFDGQITATGIGITITSLTLSRTSYSVSWTVTSGVDVVTGVDVDYVVSPGRRSHSTLIEVSHLLTPVSPGSFSVSRNSSPRDNFISISVTAYASYGAVHNGFRVQNFLNSTVTATRSASV